MDEESATNITPEVVKASGSQPESGAPPLVQGVSGEARSRFVFAQRGLIMAIVAALVLVLARPSWPSFIFGLMLAIFGETWRLWAMGFTGEHTRSQTLVTEKLVTKGPYSLVRNPLYLGNILTILGVLVASCGRLPWWESSLVTLVVVLSTYIVYSACIIAEETFLWQRFGEEFRRYRALVPALIPQASLVEALKDKQDFCRSRLRFEVSSLCLFVAVWCFLFLCLWL